MAKTILNGDLNGRIWVYILLRLYLKGTKSPSKRLQFMFIIKSSWKLSERRIQTQMNADDADWKYEPQREKAENKSQNATCKIGISKIRCAPIRTDPKGSLATIFFNNQS